MEDATFFEFSPYHLTLAVVGCIVILSRWFPRLISSREPAAAPLMILLGAGAVLMIPGLPAPPDPRTAPLLWEVMAEITVIVALFAAGMRVDSLGPPGKWAPTLRLLLIAMPLTIAAVAFLSVVLGGLTAGAAVLLAAVLAPTDPVLAADVQIAPPQEGQEHPVRFALTTEAALNDGLAFPFVYLGLILIAQGLAPAEWGLQWLLEDVIYRISIGAAMGWAGGWLLGQILFNLPRETRLADTGSGVIAIAGVFLCYGSTELVEGYGFIAVAAMGLSLRRIESEHHYHRHLHDFSESIEHALTALLLIALGGLLPALAAGLTWNHVAIAVLLIVVLRPLAGWISLTASALARSDRAVVAVYGVRGIGSIYYLAYATGYAELDNLSDLWIITALTIFLSTILHGFTVGWSMEKIGR
ncbi:sodium/proton antiporter, CPA1 family [Roseovarius nanhaiticus]|uniref:Sodium/proton antiporter, CPA1 family n=1 Tax=Roseovarius nanhaiticus TaxID=573024 RepID=A0A1N7HNR9_9RHOB|nr:cation:proton antiporter [Roseovarius nanhaiticus]SEL38637.1 sodium/proton antiporter, CPA1 family [Roseovarius nanhaiticus]SIS26463.1 sodium/proton antiporter, CPA1 family [Roseovarius nanhaiticus]